MILLLTPIGLYDCAFGGVACGGTGNGTEIGGFSVFCGGGGGRHSGVSPLLALKRCFHSAPPSIQMPHQHIISPNVTDACLDSN